MRRDRGFTIIEVMLFLAISSGLAIMLLVGTGAAIQRQQYRDVVQSYANFLRNQYEQVINVQNDRSEGACSISDDSSKIWKRGQSDCVIVGRYIQTDDTGGDTWGDKYSVRAVYAFKGANDSWKYSMGSADMNYTMSWSTRTRFKNQSKNIARIAILIYRDPEDGTMVVRTNGGRYGVNNIYKFFDGDTELGHAGDNQFLAREVCVYSDGWLSGERQSVFLGARSGSTDTITIGESSSECQND